MDLQDLRRSGILRNTANKLILDSRQPGVPGAALSTPVEDNLAYFEKFLFRAKSQSNSDPSDLSTKLLPIRLRFDDSSDSGNASQMHTPQQLLAESRKRRLEQEAELMSAKSLIIKLESKINSSETARKKICIESEHSFETNKIELKSEKQKREDLVLQIQKLIEKDADLRRDLLESHKKLDQAKLNFDQKVLSISREKTARENALQDELNDAQEKVLELQQENSRLENDLDLKETDLEESQQQLALQMTMTDDLRQQVTQGETVKMQYELATRKIKELEAQLAKQEEAAILTKALHSHLNKIPELESENKKLKDENRYHRTTVENITLLKEQNDNLKNQLDRAEERGALAGSLKVANEDLVRRLAEWEKLDSADPNRTPSAGSFLSKFGDLQAKEAVSIDKITQLNSIIRTLEAGQHAMTSQVLELQGQLTKKDLQILTNGETLKRVQRRLLLVSKERESYKRLIDSYESEVTMHHAEVVENRIQSLEQSLEEYRQAMDRLEQENDALRNASTGHTANQQSFSGGLSATESKELDRLKKEVSRQGDQIKQLEEDKMGLELQLENRALKGDYNPLTTKVLHFEGNPLSLAQSQRGEEVDKLKQENEEMKQRIRLLEERRGEILDLTQQAETKAQQELTNQAEIESLKKQVSSVEQAKQRMMEAFRKTSHEFREVCYLLTGYRLDVSSPKHYKLRSMYAENENDVLLFEEGLSGDIRMLESEFSQSHTVADLMETHLLQQHSIPAFLSALTLDLFARQQNYSSAASSPMEIVDMDEEEEEELILP